MAENKYMSMAALNQIAAEVKAGDSAVEAKIGVLDSLTTTAKSSAVAAINEVDAAVKAIDFSDKADKVASAVAGNFAGLDGDGNLTNSGYKADDFDAAGAADAVSGYSEGETAKTVKQVEALTVANKNAIGTAKTAEAEATGLFKYVDDAVAAVDSTTANKVTVKTDSTSSGMLKSYTIYQGGEEEANKVAVIDIPKDLVTTGGEIIENPSGQPAGTYLALSIANQIDPVYIPVGELCDAYTAEQNATQVQLVVSDANEISATIVAKSITATEIADGLAAEIAKGQTALTAIGKEKTDSEAGTGIYGRIEALEDAEASKDTFVEITAAEVIAAFHPATP